MKKSAFIKVITYLSFMSLFLACRNGEKNPPLITIDQTDMTVLANDVINVKVYFERGDRKVETVKISGIGEDIIIKDLYEDYKFYQGVFKKLDESSNEYEYEVRVPSDAGGTTIVVAFTIVDTKGNESSTDLTIKVETPYWREFDNGIINNALSATPNSWDLVENRKQSTYDETGNKDMEDRTSASDGNFLEGGWLSRTGTEFVLDSNFSYDKPSVERTKIAFDNGEKITFIEGKYLKEDMVILAKIRDTERISIIKITEVVDDGINGGTGNNADYRRFKYKK